MKWDRLAASVEQVRPDKPDQLPSAAASPRRTRNTHPALLNILLSGLTSICWNRPLTKLLLTLVDTSSHRWRQQTFVRVIIYSVPLSGFLYEFSLDANNSSTLIKTREGTWGTEDGRQAGSSFQHLASGIFYFRYLKQSLTAIKTVEEQELGPLTQMLCIQTYFRDVLFYNSCENVLMPRPEMRITTPQR